MIHRVVRPFPCSFDGLTLIDLDSGDERDFGGMADGLIAEGFIEAIDEPVSAEPAPAEPVAAAPIVDVVVEPALLGPVEAPQKSARGARK